MMGIYKITNMINGKAYIGQAKNIERRWKTHITKHNNPKNKEYNKVLYCAMRKYGFENFEFEILIECEEELLDLMEIYYIEKYNTYIHSENSNGYNMNKGGGGSKGAKRTRKQKKNLSIKAKERFKNKENCPFYGKKHTEESKNKSSESHKKENLSKETLEKMRNSALGRTHSEETKQKMKNNRKYGKENPNTNKVICDGIWFSCTRECSDVYGIPYGTMKGWVDGHNPMPKEWYDRGLRREDKRMIDYKIAKRTLKKKVYYNKMIFNSVKIISEYCNYPYSTMKAWLQGKGKIPQNLKDLGLRYATESDVQNYPIYNKNIK